MNLSDLPMPAHHRAVTEKFIAACQSDERILAANLYGSHTSGKADAHSDLDLALITTDEAYDQFVAQISTFLGTLGELIFLEHFSSPTTVFFFFADGTEGELTIGRESQHNQHHGSAIKVLLDKKNLLSNADFSHNRADKEEQIEFLRSQIYWFWHDLSHLITALARGQLWWAQGQLDELRSMCIALAHLAHDFSAEADGYDKIELIIPAAQLAPLQASFCPMEVNAMLEAAGTIIRYYQQLAPDLARAHGIPYPQRLEQILLDRFHHLRSELSGQ